MSPGPAVFLDRDGVVNRRLPGDWVESPARLEILPGALDAMARLTRAGHRLVIVTNQSGIGRGRLTLAQVETVHAHLRARVEERGGKIDAIYVCPHAPNDGCRCRKPGTLLLERAARDLELDLTLATMIGDSPSDIGAARAAGFARALRVIDPLEPYPDSAPRADAHFESLASAVDWFLSHPH